MKDFLKEWETSETFEYVTIAKSVINSATKEEGFDANSIEQWKNLATYALAWGEKEAYEKVRKQILVGRQYDKMVSFLSSLCELFKLNLGRDGLCMGKHRVYAKSEKEKLAITVIGNYLLKIAVDGN